LFLKAKRSCIFTGQKLIFLNRHYIDINCDVGEGIGNEATLFPFISSCNIACGGHAGDNETMTQVIRLARKHNVKVGAHPSYPDRENFGRVSMDISRYQLTQSIKTQIANLRSILKTEKVQLHHIKPHGALYNDVSRDVELARIFLDSIKPYQSSSILYLPFASIIEKEARNQGFKVAYEAFGDRNYNEDLTLVSRLEPNALIVTPQNVLKHTVYMIKNRMVNTVSGKAVKIKADTYCIHGDTPTAMQILVYLAKEFPKNNIYIKK